MGRFHPKSLHQYKATILSSDMYDRNMCLCLKVKLNVSIHAVDLYCVNSSAILWDVGPVADDENRPVSVEQQQVSVE